MKGKFLYTQNDFREVGIRSPEIPLVHKKVEGGYMAYRPCFSYIFRSPSDLTVTDSWLLIDSVQCPLKLSTVLYLINSLIKVGAPISKRVFRGETCYRRAKKAFPQINKLGDFLNRRRGDDSYTVVINIPNEGKGYNQVQLRFVCTLLRYTIEDGYVNRMRRALRSVNSYRYLFRKLDLSQGFGTGHGLLWHKTSEFLNTVDEKTVIDIKDIYERLGEMEDRHLQTCLDTVIREIVEENNK